MGRSGASFPAAVTSTTSASRCRCAPSSHAAGHKRSSRPRRPSGQSPTSPGRPVEVTVTIRLQPTAEGTRLSSDFDARPHGLFRLFFPLFLIKIRKEEAANMTYLKAALERRAAAGQASWLFCPERLGHGWRVVVRLGVNPTIEDL
jgi:hypothetical protein